MHLGNDWGIAVFVTAANIETLENSRHEHIDGTFRTVPNPYRQFLTVHGECNDRVLLCVSVLMVERNIASNRQVLQILKRKVLQVTGNGNWSPQYAITEFEIALITAFETEFPRSRIQGCYFHYSQSLWRKIQALVLSGPYRQDRHLKTLAKNYGIRFYTTSFGKNELKCSYPVTKKQGAAKSIRCIARVL